MKTHLPFFVTFKTALGAGFACLCLTLASGCASSQDTSLTANSTAPSALAQQSPTLQTAAVRTQPDTADTTQQELQEGAAKAAAARVPALLTPLAEEYKITVNDLLEIEVFGVTELKRTVRVNTSGQVAMPLIGTLSVAGLTPADAEALIAVQYARDYLQDPQVSIFVKEFTTQRITLDGALVKPGMYPLSGQITLLRALALAGGGSQLADLEQVMLFRLTPEGQSLVEKHDVLKIRKGEARDPMLQSDDVVVVNRNSKRAVLRDALFRDVIDTLNPFSSAYRNAVAP